LKKKAIALPDPGHDLSLFSARGSWAYKQLKIRKMQGSDPEIAAHQKAAMAGTAE